LYFLFVQFEFTHAVGPHAARYIVERGSSQPAGRLPADGESPRTLIETRNEDVAGVSRRIGAADVLVVGVVPAPAMRPRLLRRARPIEDSTAPATVPLSLVTFVKGTMPFDDEREANRRLETIRASEEHQDAYVAEALDVLNLAIRAYRSGAPDPYAVEVTRRDARCVRIGYGQTQDVQDGQWRAALELPPPRGPRAGRTLRLRPAEAVAAVLSGRATVLEADDVLARALIDLDNHRTRAAAVQLGAALKLLPGELAASWSENAQRAVDLESAAADRALDDAEAAELESIIESLQAALGTWRYESAG
jgi:hypothetical protein